MCGKVSVRETATHKKRAELQEEKEEEEVAAVTVVVHAFYLFFFYTLLVVFIGIVTVPAGVWMGTGRVAPSRKEKSYYYPSKCAYILSSVNKNGDKNVA